MYETYTTRTPQRIRAKFTVQSKTVWNPGGEVVLNPVYSTDPTHENKAFWEATPNGKITLGIQNQAAFDGFLLGKEYYVTFEQAGG